MGLPRDIPVTLLRLDTASKSKSISINQFTKHFLLKVNRLIQYMTIVSYQPPFN